MTKLIISLKVLNGFNGQKRKEGKIAKSNYCRDNISAADLFLKLPISTASGGWVHSVKIHIISLCTSQIEASTSPPGIPRAFDAFPCLGGRESLASMSCYESRWIHGGDGKLWWIQRKRWRIYGGLVENQRSTQAVLSIWRCLRPIYIYII